MICPRCRNKMTEVKGHIFHKKRKWRCAHCGRVRMQSPKPKKAATTRGNFD